MPHQRFPKVEILSYQNDCIKFVLSKTDISMANTLRRIMIAEVPTMTIDLVEYYENTTVLNDEYIAHRLGLFPLKYISPTSNNSNNNNNSDGPNHDTDNIVAQKGGDCSEAFVSHRDCICFEHCSRCSVEFICDVQYLVPGSGGGGGHGTEEEENDDVLAPLTITSKDLVSNNIHVQPAHFVSVEEQEDTQDDGIAIVKLGPGQKLKFKAIAHMGISKEHAKWCPVAVATYRFWPIVHINAEEMASLSMEQKQFLVDTCPDQIIEIDAVTGEIVPVERYWDIATYTEDLDFAQKSLKKRKEDDDFITITPSTDTFIFTVESTGAMDAYEIVKSALKVLKRKLNDLARELEADHKY